MTFENGRLTPEQAMLPERYEEPTVMSMLPGETTYATPWSMWFDEEGKGWLSGESTLHERPGDTVEMWVARVESGFVADISGLQAQWRRQPSPSGFGGQAEYSLPVVGIITNSTERQIAEEHLRQLK
jgi:hypothetical protein